MSSWGTSNTNTNTNTALPETANSIGSFGMKSMMDMMVTQQMMTMMTKMTSSSSSNNGKFEMNQKLKLLICLLLFSSFDNLRANLIKYMGSLSDHSLSALMKYYSAFHKYRSSGHGHQSKVPALLSPD